MEGLLGGLAGSGGSSAGIGNLLSAFGGQGGQGQFSGLMGSGGGADVGQILSIIQQNPQFKVLKSFVAIYFPLMT